MFTGVEGLGYGFYMKETAGKIEVQVGNGVIGVVRKYEEACDVLWPFNAPHDRNVVLPPLLRL